jgi:CRP/FNR family transcriptional regulator, cyclic AMP receptor protein
MATIEEILHEHPFFTGAPAKEVALVAGCGRNRLFHSGEYLCREGEPANEFFLIREGKVGLDIVAPGRGPIVFETLGTGEFVGDSWLVPPYRWTFDARAIELTRTIGIDAACLRGKCETDREFGYEMMKRFLVPLVQRLQAARLQILDVYGKH